MLNIEMGTMCVLNIEWVSEGVEISVIELEQVAF